MTTKQYEDFFRTADVNNDKELTFEELTKMLKKNGYRGSNSELKKFFRSVDTSNDGKISYEEYMTAMGVIPEKDHKQATCRRVFNEFDKDGSGEIDVKELGEAFKEMGKHFSEEEMKRMISLADTDGSKTLNYEEFVKYVFGV